jgi:hypothetical protein
VLAQYRQEFQLNNSTEESIGIAKNLSLAIDCAQEQPAGVNVQDAHQQYIFLPETIDFSVGLNQFSNVDPLMTAPYFETVEGYYLRYTCHPLTLFNSNAGEEMYWALYPTFLQSNATKTYEKIFSPNQGFCFFCFNADVLPDFLTDYSASVLLLYAGEVYLIATLFRSAFIPQTSEIFIINAPDTEKIINICQCVYIYRVQKNLKNEEELYFLLIEIMRQPQMIRDLCGSSLKTELG